MPARSQPIRIVFVLTELTLGGAELMLWKLLSRIDRSRFDPFVFALSSNADGMLRRFRDIDVQCEFVGMRPRIDAVAGVLRLARGLRSLTPDIVQGWLYHGNLAATLAALLMHPRKPVLWSIRGTLPGRLSHEKWQSALTIWLGSKLSSLPTKIVYNSLASAVEHGQRLGYRRDTEVIVPNGFDTEVFCPSEDARSSVRDMLRLPRDTLLVGLIGRYHPMKDHANFLRAAALLRETHPGVHFLLAGTGVEPGNLHLTSLIQELRLNGCAHLLGHRDDVEVVTASLDIACSSSYVEGFANVIGEAMSCGVPCVVTDVSDAARIVADTGNVVPPRDSHALVQSLRQLIDIGHEQRRALGLRARARIIDNYALDAVVGHYEALYSQVFEMFARRVRA